jgi:replication factor C subunit 3/5
VYNSMCWSPFPRPGSHAAVSRPRVVRYPFTDTQTIDLPDWQRYVGEVARNILSEQTPRRCGLTCVCARPRPPTAHAMCLPRLQEVRGQLYELLVHCIPPTVVLKVAPSQMRAYQGARALTHTRTQTLALELVRNLDGQLKSSVVQQAAWYEHRMQQGSKPIFHLEAFVAKFMSLYQQFLVDLAG